MQALGLEWEASVERVRADLSELLLANGLAGDESDARIRLTVTGGLSDGRIRLARSHPPTVLMTAGRLVPPSDDEYERGIALATATFRQPWDAPLARIKTIHRLEYLMAREEALAAGADDGLLLDDRGHVAEGTASNVLLVAEGRVRTPSLDGPILAGVTREAVLEAAGRAGLPVEEGTVTVEALRSADEVFVTSTSWEVLAVRALDGEPVGGGRRGPQTKRIHAAFRDLVVREVGS
jgi:branched-chain amino acid aminotransferase